MLTAKVSLIATVLNEAGSIREFINSVLNQSQLPDEIIIVDAGSTDRTISMLQQYPQVKLVVKPGLNRSQARNLAVSLAKNPLIAVSDAGCRLDQDWLKRLTAPFIKERVDAVAGYYQVASKTIWQQCLAPFVAVMPDKFNLKTYLPSSRSLAFTKAAWEKINGYPEQLNYCEDLIFAANLKFKTKLIVIPEAIVFWALSKNILTFFHQIFFYSRGDVQARYWPHLRKIAMVFGRYLLFIILPPLLLIYPLFPILKHYHYVKQPLALIYLPLIQFTVDLAVITGAVSGIIRR